jgi:hypothetical protein
MNMNWRWLDACQWLTYQKSACCLANISNSPAAPLDQLLMHDGDLPGRAAEADKAEFEPKPEGFAKA